MPKVYSDYTKQVVIYVPPQPGPQTGRYIAKIAAGGNQGNRTRNRQVLSEIYRVGVGRKEAQEWRTVETERKELFYAVFRKMLLLCNANRTDCFYNIF